MSELQCNMFFTRSAGKVVDVQRRTAAGFARGQLLLEGTSSGSGVNGGAGSSGSGHSTSGDARSSGSSSGGGTGKQRLRIHFQNENLVAEEAEDEQQGGAEGRWATAHHPALGTAESGSGSGGSGSSGGRRPRVLATVPDLICCIEEDSELGCSLCY